mmetsp:Transcript_96788/g.273711  ORF Transcript_96788/g.273711 Transcript_96788/m.273711 type:complete len:322 (+) Transcript_96788:1-966(+)
MPARDGKAPAPSGGHRKPLAVFLQVGTPKVWPDLQQCLSNVLEGANGNTTFPPREVDVHLGFPKRTEPDITKDALLVSGQVAELVQKWNDGGGRAPVKLFVNDTLENKGADIGVFLQQALQVQDPSRYGLLLKVHSKSTDVWRCQALTSLCGTAEQVREILLRFDEQPELGFLGPWALTWTWDTPVLETYCKLGDFGFRKNGVEKDMKNVWESIFKNKSFPSREQYAMSAGTMWWSRSAPLLEDAQLRDAASWFVPSLPVGYSTSCSSLQCHIPFALERILPTIFTAWYGLVFAEAPNKVIRDKKNRACKADATTKCITRR